MPPGGFLALLEPAWRTLAFWEVLLGRLGALFGRLGAHLGSLGPLGRLSREVLELAWGFFGTSWNLLWALVG
eukprot:7587079-Pyramimonas_sp.AAC.1